MPDIIDADFEVVRGEDGSPIPAPKPESANSAEALSAAGRDKASNAQLGVFAAKPLAKAEAMPAWKFGLIAGFASLAAFMLAGGYSSISKRLANNDAASTRAPSSGVAGQPGNQANAPVIAINGLTLQDVTFEKRVANGREYLSVEGVVRNGGDSPKLVPPLRLIFGSDGNKARYRLNRGETLAAGEQLVFTSRIPLRDTDPTQPQLGFIR